METKSHNKILLERFQAWLCENEKNDEQFRYQSEIINHLMPLTRWYRVSTEWKWFGTGRIMDDLPSSIFTDGKINYCDEAFTHTVNAIAKWPIAYRLMYQRNRTVNLEGKQGRQLAGDEWVEDFVVRPFKQFSSAQSLFVMVEMMSRSINLLEMNRQMHKKPASMYDQLKVAQFAIKEEWFHSGNRDCVKVCLG